MESKFGSMNSVSAKGQLPSNEYVSFFENGGDIKVLFVGNSITRHAPNSEIGWHGNWGMAASCKENDYVHQVVKSIEEHSRVDYCIAQCAEWERNFAQGEFVLNKYYSVTQDFGADIIIFRLGENVGEINDVQLFKKSFEDMISFFNNNKKAQVIITNLFWCRPEINEIIKEIVTEHNYTLCDISDLEKDEKTMALGCYEHQGICVHPNDYGMKCISERIVGCISLD